MKMDKELYSNIFTVFVLIVAISYIVTQFYTINSLKYNINTLNQHYAPYNALISKVENLKKLQSDLSNLSIQKQNLEKQTNITNS
jgi:glucan phosphoethanolaminetransferase (alkaline phosphatase superfamily)